MDADKRLLAARINDLFGLCTKHCEPKFSPFLDGGELAFIEDEFRIPYGYNVMTFGGYENAERKIFGVFPEWQDAETEEFPITILRFDTPKFGKIGHRDYLGTLMSLGIDRNKTGDILTDDGGAYAFVMSDIAEYAVCSITKIANVGVKGHIIETKTFKPPRIKTEEYMCVCASLRADAVAGTAFNISRSTVEKLIAGGGMKINHRIVSDRSVHVDNGDLISLKGYGRFILKDAGNNTRKGRLHITVEKF